MSDWLYQFQETVRSYPPWLVLGVGVVAAALILLLLSKAMRVLAYVLAFAVLAGAGWLAWQHVFG